MLARLFEEQVRQYPERTAVKTKDEALTYAGLNALANRLAHRILAYEGHLSSDPTVSALLFEHGADMITGTMGTVKAGRIYVPLDPTYPEDRLQYILRDSGARQIITNTRNQALAARLAGALQIREVITLEEIHCTPGTGLSDSEQNDPQAVNLDLPIPGDRIAYLLYTSGSTGRPKGVMQTHENVCYYARCYRKTAGLTAEDRLTLFSAFSHDAAIVDIYSGLLSGAALFPMSIKEIHFPDLAKWLVREKITIYHSVPTVYRYFLQELREGMEFPDLRFIVLGGEGVLKHDVVSFQKYFGEHTALMNLYGQSESSYNSAQIFHHSTPFTKVTLGQPNEDLEFFVIGENGGEVDTLGVGEIVVLCSHVARGYWQDAEKTGRAFGESANLGRFYRTGDLGRVLMDGTVEFMGRKDFQVKIRGFRVEPGEIESQLLKHPAVKEAVVIALDDPMGNKFLAAYFTVRDEVMVNEIRSFLAGLVPDYMVPAYFIVMEQIPTMPNGKTDRKALEALGIEAAQKTEYVAPATGTEKILAAILAEILGTEKVGVMDNFFELGVHSLRAISLMARIYQELKVQIPLKDIFQTPTIRELAQRITGMEKIDYTAIEAVEERDLYPLSSAQKRLYLLQQMDLQGMGYNMPKVVEIQGAVERSRMEAVFRALIRRHGSLRTSFHFVEGEPVQRVHPDAEFALTEIRCKESAFPGVIREFVRPFDLEKAPLFRAALVTVADGAKAAGADMSQTAASGQKENGTQSATASVRNETGTQSATASVRNETGTQSATASGRKETGTQSSGECRHFLLLDMHHIITDGTSMGIFFRDFVNLYMGKTLPEPALQYKDFSVWQNRLFATEAFHRHEQYWLNALSGEIPVLNLPTDFPRPQVMDFAGDTYRFQMDEELTEGLNGLARQHGATLYMVLLAGYALLLARYSRQDEVLVGAPVAGRNRADLQEIMGMFVNTLVMRTAPAGDKPVSGFLRELRDYALQAFEHQDYQFEMLVERMELRRDLSRNPFFDVSFVLQNTEAGDLNISDLKFVGMEAANPVVKFDLSLVGYEVNGQIHCKLEYRTSLFRHETIERMAGHFVNLLRSMIRQPEGRLAELEMLSAEERNALLDHWNRTEKNYPEKTMIQLFLEQAAATPGQPAVMLGQSSMTYRELEEASRKVAAGLCRAGVGVGTIVGLMAERSFEMIIGILAIWKAGGAYLPIDPAYPRDRIEYMISDSGIEVLVAQRTPMVAGVAEAVRVRKESEIAAGMTDAAAASRLRIIYLAGGGIRDEAPADGPGSAEEEARPCDLAYIIYTSGSTGKPKGVMMHHRGAANTLQWRRELYGMTAADRVLQLFSFSFDGFVTSSMTPLFSGAALVLLEEEKARDPLAIKEVIAKKGITQFIVVPSLFAGLLDCLTPKDVASLRTVALGGEKVPPKLVETCKALKAEIRICNEYGPTETAITSTYQDHLELGEPITIGRAIANMKMYVLDSHRQLVPVGVPGEIYMAGTGLATGYWNRPELTAERFVPNPWAEGERMYRTGDLGRRHPDGMVEFVGRVDHQVKIRGYRIETGEIEAELLAHPVVREAVVLDRLDGNGNACLVAYAVIDAGQESDRSTDWVGALRSDLKINLPDYMIPAHIVLLEQMPLTPNGKLDRQALPEPDESALAQGEYVAPTGSVEASIAEIWEEVLGLEQVGVHHNFFDLGGHSLNAVRIIGLIHKRCHAAVTLRDLFQNPTVAGLANLIHHQEISIVEEIPVLPKQPCYEVSYAQKRLWYINQMNSDSAAYNIAGRGYLDHHVEEGAIQRAFERLLQRHESLRTCFKMLPEGLVQVIEEKVNFAVQIHDLSGLPAGEQTGKADAIYRDISSTLFDLETAPLCKVALVKLREDYYELFCAMHHIISDGWSMEIMNRELVRFYEAEREAEPRIQAAFAQSEAAAAGEPAVTHDTPVTHDTAEMTHEPEISRVQYKDFAAWQNRMLHDSKKTEPLLAFWTEYFGGTLPIVNIPADYARAGLTGRASAKYRCVVPAAVQERLKEIARENHASLFMVLLAGFNIFLSRITGQKDILLEIPAAGRDHHALKQLIGFFINTLFVRSRLEPEENFTAYLERTRKDTLQVLESQIYPMEWILEEIKVKYPTVPVFFNMLNVGEGGLEELTHPEPEHLQDVNETKFEMVFYLKEYANGIEIKCHYLSGLFKPATIEFFLSAYLRILAGIAADPHKRVKEYGQEERKRRVLLESECKIHL